MTKSIAKSVVVSQRFNPRFDRENPSQQNEFVYHVEKTVNTLQVHIGQYLVPCEVQNLIDSEVNVTVQPVK